VQGVLDEECALQAGGHLAREPTRPELDVRDVGEGLQHMVEPTLPRSNGEVSDHVLHKGLVGQEPADGRSVGDMPGRLRDRSAHQ